MGRALHLMAAACVGSAVSALSCAVENGVPEDASGSSGGAPGSGGAASTSGGVPASGGTFSSAGSSSTSGGSGGAGVAGSGGASGSLGAGGSAGGTTGAGGSVSTTGYTFDANDQGFLLNYKSPADLGASVTWIGTEGDPAPGALQLDAAFAALDQKVNVALIFAGPTSFAGKTISAHIKVASGITSDASNPGGAKLFVKTGDAYVYASTDWNNLELNAYGTWITLTLPVDTPFYVDAAGTHDPAAVREIGIEIATSSTSADYAPAVVYIDTITY